MSEKLLAISLGPVQDFIAAARKTRDLWFGSWMLSELSRAAAKELHDAGATLIFPAPESVRGKAAIANKLLATTDRDPAALAASARSAAQARLEQFAAQALGARGDLVVDEALLQEQLQDFLEFYAAWVPASAETYADSRRNVERLLAGRKALRDFSPAHGRPGVPKSSLDPSREMVVELPPPDDRRAGEKLDGISLVKRLASEQRFVSVSRVAVDPLVRCLADREPDTLQQLRQIVEGLRHTGAVEPFTGLDQFQAFAFDTELWYREDERVEEQTEEGRAFRRVVDGALRRLEVGDPPAYYAVLAADGDQMGRLIGALHSVAEHQALSRQLVAFAAEAEQIVARHQGALVYSGGDDVLAFLPLDRALACADALRRAFNGHVKGSNGTLASLTVGLALVHYLEPLGGALAWARAAEQEGKRSGRNALTVALHTRSGGAPTRVTASWESDPVGGRWNRWLELLRGDALPGRAAYELRRLSKEMQPLGDGSGKAIAAEARRILRRKRQPGNDAPLRDADVDMLLAGVNEGTAAAALQQIADELIIARRIAALGMAEPGGAAP